IQLEEKRWHASRDRVVRALRAENVGAVVPDPPAYRSRAVRWWFRDPGRRYPNTERATGALIGLPLWAGMTEGDAEDVIAAVVKVAAAYAT
ncbi:MAG TPA: DegT/DnrJ/EryC1/StrS family aminotransferase, partial [Gemmataceae bacterium]|nr:DegT/DnrJ/EryC1/StrS family aminotransferase [Gemmataceae bacterium]